MQEAKQTFTVTRSELARLLRTTPDRISKYIAEGMPALEVGGGRGRPTRLDLAAALPWILQRRTGSVDEARTRWYQAQAERSELDTRQRRGELAEIADVRAEYAEIATAVKARMRAIPDGVADQVAGLSPPAVKVLLMGKIDEALRELARRGRETDGDAGCTTRA